MAYASILIMITSIMNLNELTMSDDARSELPEGAFHEEEVLTCPHASPKSAIC